MARLDQKIGLGIDFTRFDAQLGQVADKIETAGKAASAKAGGVAGDLAAGKLDPGKVNDLVAGVGSRLATGMADGVRRASSLMLGFTARIEKMLDRLVGAAVTIFRRIDAAMKFPAFDTFFKSAQLKLSNFSALWRKPLSDVDLAIRGGFGGTIAKVAKVLKGLFDDLAARIGVALKEAVMAVSAEFARLVANMSRGEAVADALLATTRKTAAAAASGPRFPRFAPAGPPGTSRRPFPGVGRRIGAGTDFEAPPAPPAARAGANMLPVVGKAAAQAFLEASRAALTLGSVVAKVGAAMISVPLRVLVPFRRLGNFLSSLGDVGKQSFHKLYEEHGLLMGSLLAVTKLVGGLGRAMIRVGTLGTFGRAAKDADRFGKATKRSALTVGGLTGSVRSLGRELLVAFGVVGVIYKTVQFFKDGIKGASDLNETVSRSKVVFGDAFGPVEAQSKELNRAFGISRQAQLDVASGFGAMAQGAGYTEEASAKLANQLTKMAADLSSSVNIPFEEAGAKIRSALAGQSEPLRQFGVNITEDAVKSYALASGISRSSKAISEQEKVTARAALVMRGLGYAQGDLERTSDSAANQFRKAGGGIREFGVRIGELLLPAVQKLTEAFNTLLGAALDLFEGSLPTIQGWAKSVAAAMENVAFVARNLGTLWKIAQLRVGEFVINTIAWIETIPANFGPITQWLGRNWSNLLTDLLEGAKVAFTNLLDNAVRFGEALWEALKGNGFEFEWTPLLDGFKATTEKLPDLIRPDLISVDDEVNALWAEIAGKEKARADALNRARPATPKRPGEVMEPGKTPEYKLASAVEIGSKEAYSIIARTLAPGRNGDPARDQVREQRTGNAVLRNIEANTRRGGMPLVVK